MATTPAHAGTGAEGYFTIYNNTDNNVVVGFYTSDGSSWSGNWLADDGGKTIDNPINIDMCDASNVYLDDNEIYYD
ncbi:MAG: hypothetical protein ABJO86_06785 [Lentilitoribacter sp.]